MAKKEITEVINQVAENTKDTIEPYLKYFDDFCKEDVDIILTFCQTAGKKLYDNFKMKYKDPKLIAVIFALTFDTALECLLELRSTKSFAEINFYDFVIGFSTYENDEDEKQGNFMVYMRNIENKKKSQLAISDEDIEENPTYNERVVLWKNSHVIEQPEMIKKISSRTVKTLKEYGIIFDTDEYVIPIFCITYETMVEHLALLRRDKGEFEVEINYMGLFSIGAREAEDGHDTIFISPNIASKLKGKSDKDASGKYEDE